jgi:hypothetical protein
LIKIEQVLIICDSKLSISEYEVIDWISQKEYLCSLKSFQKLISEDALNIESNESSRLTLVLAENYKSIWFRHDEEFLITNNSFLQNDASKNLRYNFKVLFKAFSFFAKNQLKTLSTYESFFLNKLTVLEAATEIGIDIPHTLLCNNKKQLSSLVSEFGSMVCKSAGENLTLFFDNNKQALKQYVVEIDEKMLKDLPEKFFPTLFQQQIDKQMDLRIFYLDGKFFPMAIFSQCMDYREDYHNHRNVPIKLPDDLENKLHQLMQKLDLNTGSIDMVRCAKTKKYYFLEVNPNGQFGMVSKPCNYYLEKEIAEFLTT